MDNHLHALDGERAKPNIAVGMKLFQQTYVRRFNDRHGRMGPLFQGQLRRPCSSTRDEHHMATLRYIPLNPVSTRRVWPTGAAGAGRATERRSRQWSASSTSLDVDAVAATVRRGCRGVPPLRRARHRGCPRAGVGTRLPLEVLLTREPGGIRTAHDEHGYSLRQYRTERWAAPLGHRRSAASARLRSAPEGSRNLWRTSVPEVPDPRRSCYAAVGGGNGWFHSAEGTSSGSSSGWNQG